MLDVLRAATDGRGIAYWRDKSGREVDFVLARRRDVDAIECKIQPGRFDPSNLETFRRYYPRGRNFVVSPGVADPYDMRAGALVARVLDCRHLLDLLGSQFRTGPSGAR